MKSETLLSDEKFIDSFATLLQSVFANPKCDLYSVQYEDAEKGETPHMKITFTPLCEKLISLLMKFISERGIGYDALINLAYYGICLISFSSLLSVFARVFS